MRRRVRRGLSGFVIVVLSAIVLTGTAQADSGPAVWAWGFADSGQLGDGKTIPGANGGQTTPVRVQLPPGVQLTAVSVGAAFEVGVDQHGRAWAWGDNSYGDLGFGDVNPSSSLLPRAVRMPKGIRFTAVASGSNFTVALDQNGALWGWGADGLGQLADGAPNNVVPAPVRGRMPAGIRFTAIAAGHSLFAVALDEHGDAWAWGNNDQGELGTGDTTAHTTPVRVVMPPGVAFRQVAAGGVGGPGGGAHVVALDRTGQVWDWGDNGTGDLGDNTTTNRATPVRAELPAGTHIVKVAAAGFSSMALDTTGQLWGWGGAGNIGAGDQFSRAQFGQGAGETHVPVRARQPSGVRFVDAAGGQSVSVALDQHGDAWTFGDNAVGELGNATAPTQFSLSPVRVRMPPGVHWTAVAAGGTSNTLLGFVAAKPARTSGWRLSSIAATLMSPAQALRPVSSMAVSATVAVAGALFLTFPANLFNATIDENYADVSAWWRRRRRRGAAAPEHRRDLGHTWRAFTAVLLVGGLLNCLLDPGFGWHRSSATTYLGVLLSMAVGIVLSGLVNGGYHRARHGSAPRAPHALPLGLLVAGGCVLLSRLVGFQPGYLYGVVCGIVFIRELPRHEKGHVVLLSAWTTLLVGVAAWFAIVPLNHYEKVHGYPMGVVLAHNLLAGLFTGALAGCVLGLLPLRFLPGAHLRAWSNRAWAATFVLVLFGLVQILLRPHTSRPSHAPIVTAIVLFVAFGALSIGVRHYFSRRSRLARGEPAPMLRTTLAELIPRPSPPADEPRRAAL